MSPFRIRVSKDHLVFSASHFITYNAHQCESLHGHNYRVSVALEGGLDENGCVFDFIALKRLVKSLVDELDHRMLLARHSPLVTLAEDDGCVQATYKERVYVFPRKDVVILPISNTTAEMLAQYLVGRLKSELVELGASNVTAIEAEVEESFGQSATYREPVAI